MAAVGSAACPQIRPRTRFGSRESRYRHGSSPGPPPTAHRLLGHLLPGTYDKHRVDGVGLHLTRTATLEQYLDLLGVRRRELPVPRAVFAELPAGCRADVEPRTGREETDVRRLPEGLIPVLAPGHCPVGAQPLSEPEWRVYRSRRCGTRAPTLRRRGWLPASPVLALPAELTPVRGGTGGVLRLPGE
ncbi:hypothetical protein ABIA38_003328 [Embleya sp. AB8]